MNFTTTATGYNPGDTDKHQQNAFLLPSLLLAKRKVERKFANRDGIIKRRAAKEISYEIYFVFQGKPCLLP